MAIDHFIMTFIATMIAMPCVFISAFGAIRDSMQVADSSPFIFKGWVMYVCLIGFAFYFCKDCIQGRSIAKRILRLQVVNNKTGEVAGPLRCFVRNIFCVLWFVEWIVVLVNPERRIGDMVAGTKVVKYVPRQERTKVNFLQLILALALAYGVLLLFMLPVNSFMNRIGSHIKYENTSYNVQESNATEKLFADSLGAYLTAHVKVYDSIPNRPGKKYVLVVFDLKKDYVDEENDYSKIKSITVPLLYTKFPRKTFIGQLKYVYETDYSWTSKSFQLDWEDEK